jgi:CheY-like chemotaxis protein
MNQALILVIDDDAANREIAEAFLMLDGFSVITAVDAYSGIRAVEQKHPALVLLDVRLPDLNGDAVCQKLKLSQPHLPIIMTSGYEDAEMRALLKQAGADSFLARPFTSTELAQLVRQFLEAVD